MPESLTEPQGTVIAQGVAEELVQHSALPPGEQPRVFSRLHENGELHSGTAAEVGRVCTGLANLPPKEQETLLEMHEVGSRILAERQRTQPSADAKPRPVIRKVGKPEPVRPSRPEPVTMKEQPVQTPAVAAPEAPVRSEIPFVRAPKAAEAAEAPPIVLSIEDTKPRAVREAPEPTVKVAAARTEEMPPYAEPPRIVTSRPDFAPVVPVPEYLAYRPPETLSFESIFPAVAEASEQDTVVPIIEETADPLSDEHFDLAHEASAPRLEDEPLIEWGEVDLSSEVGQLLAELGLTPARAETVVAGETEAVTIRAYSETVAEPASEDIISSFTEVLQEATPLVEGQEAPVLTVEKVGAESSEDPLPAPLILHEVAAKIDQIEPEVRQEAAQIMLDIAAAVQKIAELPPNAPEEIYQKAAKELEEFCAQLLVVAGIEADKQSIKSFARILQQINMANVGKNAASEIFVDPMHERRPGSIQLSGNPFATALQSSATASVGYLALGMSQLTTVQ